MSDIVPIRLSAIEVAGLGCLERVRKCLAVAMRLGGNPALIEVRGDVFDQLVLHGEQAWVRWDKATSLLEVMTGGAWFRVEAADAKAILVVNAHRQQLVSCRAPGDPED